MNVQFRKSPEQASSVHAKTAIADCDIHPARATKTELYPYLARRWHAHLETYDKHPYQGMMEGPPFPKAQPNASINTSRRKSPTSAALACSNLSKRAKYW